MWFLFEVSRRVPASEYGPYGHRTSTAVEQNWGIITGNIWVSLHPMSFGAIYIATETTEAQPAYYCSSALPVNRSALHYRDIGAEVPWRFNDKQIHDCDWPTGQS